jgi:hypothetical protein
MSTDEKLDKIIFLLERIEARQIRTTEMVQTVKEQEAPVVGSFGTIDSGEKK